MVDSTLITGFGPGAHEIYLELVNNDHTSLAAPVWTETINITIE